MSQTEESEGPVVTGGTLSGDLKVPHNGNGKAVEQEVPPSLLTLIDRATASGNIDALERLVALWERNEARLKEAAAEQRVLDAKRAFVRMHHEMPQIEKKGKVDTVTRRGGNIKYGFAQLEDIDEVARPIMAKHGFGLTFRPIEQTADYLIVEGELMHENGWSITARKQEPIDKEAYMGIQQKGGTAQTFGIRYLTVALLNIVVKGEDTDGRTRERETGPVTPPPSEKSMGNKWAKDREVVLKNSGADWWKVLAGDFNMAETSEDLEALVDLVRDNVNALDEGKQKTIGANLMKARNRLAARKEPAPEKFDFLVRSADGETDGELFSDPAAWVREFKEYWNSASGADDRENLLHHNADALAAARKSSKVLLKDVDEWREETGVSEEPITPLPASAVQPPMNNGKPNWNAWLGAIQEEMFVVPTPTDMAAWVEAQREVLSGAEILARQIAVRLIAKTCNGMRVEKPDWLRSLILPPKAAANHREWAEARMAELYWVTDKEAFDVAVKDAMARMQIIKKDEPATFDRVKAAFTEKQGTFT
jgi:hypothetical protein